MNDRISETSLKVTVRKKRVVQFPVQWIECTHMTDRVRTVQENVTVNCWYCKKSMLINQDTAYYVKSKMVDVEDNIPFVRCPNCNKRVSIVYYADQIEENSRKNAGMNRRRAKIIKSIFAEGGEVDV